MIRPIQMQMLVPQTENVGTDRIHEQQKVMSTNTEAANEVAKEVQHNSEAVIQKDPNAFNEYKYDAREEGNGTYQNPKKRKKKSSEETEGDDENSGMKNTKKKEPPRVNIQI